MGKEQKKFAKKKEREREVRKKVLARRESIRKEAKEQRIKDALEEKYRDKPKAFVRKEKAEQQEIRKALEHNLEILKALEEEYLSQLTEEERAKVPNPEEELAKLGKELGFPKLDAEATLTPIDGGDKPLKMPTKFKGVFQEADPINRNPPKYPWKP